MAKTQQLITPAEKLDALGEFEGSRVIATAVEIPGAGGGLRDALTVDPQLLHKEERVYVLIEGTVGKVRFDPVRDSNGAVRRVHVLDVQAATIVSPMLAVEHLEEQARKIEEAKGIQRLAFDDEGDPAVALLREEDAGGFHGGGLIVGCPLCEEEREAEAAEAETP